MTTNDFYSLIAQNDLTLVDFYATWCGPCKAMDPIIDRLSAMLNKRATIIRIDIDRKEHREIVARYNIVAVPTFVLFRDGEIVWRESGVMPIERIENSRGRHDKRGGIAIQPLIRRYLRDHIYSVRQAISSAIRSDAGHCGRRDTVSDNISLVATPRPRRDTMTDTAASATATDDGKLLTAHSAP